MFNPYAIRPIGSDKFFEHLKDVQTSAHYKDELPCTMDISINGAPPWIDRNGKSIEGYEELYLAVVALAFVEYLEDYKKRTEIEAEYGQNSSYWLWNSRCIELENVFFRKNGYFIEQCFDKLLQCVCWEGIAEIDKCIYRFQRVLRWTRSDVKRKRRSN